MTFGQSISTVFSKYADVSGRASRSEFWYWVLFAVLLSLAVSFAGSTTLDLIVTLAILLPNITVSVRRLHDLDKSGWWYLIVLVPLIGAIVLLIWFIEKGVTGSNQYGPDPLA